MNRFVTVLLAGMAQDWDCPTRFDRHYSHRRRRAKPAYVSLRENPLGPGLHYDGGRRNPRLEMGRHWRRLDPWRTGPVCHREPGSSHQLIAFGGRGVGGHGAAILGVLVERAQGYRRVADLAVRSLLYQRIAPPGILPAIVVFPWQLLRRRSA